MAATTLRLDISVDGSRQVSWCHRIWCRGTWRGEGLLDTVQVASFEIRGGNSRNPSGWPPFSVHPSQGDFRHLSCQERSVEDDNSVRASSWCTFSSDRGSSDHLLKKGIFIIDSTGVPNVSTKLGRCLRREGIQYWAIFSKQPFFKEKLGIGDDSGGSFQLSFWQEPPGLPAERRKVVVAEDRAAAGWMIISLLLVGCLGSIYRLTQDIFGFIFEVIWCFSKILSFVLAPTTSIECGKSFVDTLPFARSFVFLMDFHNLFSFGKMAGVPLKISSEQKSISKLQIWDSRVFLSVRRSKSPVALSWVQLRVWHTAQHKTCR